MFPRGFNLCLKALITLSKIDSLTRPEFVMFTEMLRYARLSEYADGTVTNPANTKTKLMKRLLKVCKGPLGNPDRKANPLYGGVLMRILMQVFLISDDMTTAKSYTQKRLQDKVFNKCLYLVSCNIVITVLEVIKIRADIESDLGLLLPSLQEIIDSPLKFYEYIMVIKKLLTVGNRKNPIYSKRTMYSKLLKDLSVSFSKIFKLKIAKDSSVEFHLLYVAFLYGNSELHKVRYATRSTINYIANCHHVTIALLF